MSAKPATFRQADLTRTAKAMEAAKIRDYRVEIGPDGTIAVIVGGAATKPARRNSMDDLLGR